MVKENIIIVLCLLILLAVVFYPRQVHESKGKWLTGGSFVSNEMKTVSDTDLKKSLIEGLASLNTTYDSGLGLKMSAYLREYSTRGLSDSTVDSLNNSLIIKLGPCWGIPNGECRE